MRVLHASSPQTVNNQPTGTVPGRRAGLSSSAFFDVLFTAGAVLVVLLALWIRNAVEATVAERTGDLAARAVMREGMTEEQARRLAEQLEREEPGLRTTVVGPDEARSRLALQENWMRHLPEVELTELPTVLELRHPMLLEDPFQVTAFHERLQERPEVQFVQFNALGYDSLVRFTRQAREIARWTSGTIVVALGTLYLIFALVRGHKKRRTGRLMATIAGALAGAAGFHFLLRAMGGGGEAALPGRVTLAVMGTVVGATVVFRLAGNLIRSATQARSLE